MQHPRALKSPTVVYDMVALLCALAVFTAVSGEGHDYHHAPQPYKFGYTVKDHHGEKYREESGDGHGNVKGSYGFSDDRGVHRQVNYVADHGGFRAQVKTNEKGTANQDPAHVNIVSAPPYAGAVGSGYGAANVGYNAGYGYDGYRAGYGGYGYGRDGYDQGYGGYGYGGYGRDGYGQGGYGYGGYGRGGYGAYGYGRY